MAQVGQDIDAKKKTTGQYAPGHILREVESKKYLVKWDKFSKDPDEVVAEADIRVPQYQVPRSPSSPTKLGTPISARCRAP